MRLREDLTLSGKHSHNHKFKNYLFSGTMPSKTYHMTFIPLTALLNLTVF